MNWDDLRFVLVLSRVGSLARAAKSLEVDHTTVGRRIAAAEASLGLRLFTRTTRGYVATAEAERLIASMQRVEEAALEVERGAQATGSTLEGNIRVTSPETFGVVYLAPRLAAFGLEHPGLTIELLPGGEVLDLGRRQAEVAIRGFRTQHESLAVKRVGSVAYGLYASVEYLKRRPLETAAQLTRHPVLTTDSGPETRWLKALNPRARATFVSTLSLSLAAAARASAGVAVLPRYLGDADALLRLVSMPGAVSEPLWLTCHRDLRQSPRVRALLDFLTASLKRDEALLAPS
ncbi:MAG: LysR family transcriptional regulator [Myxococcaceae bacterium]